MSKASELNYMKEKGFNVPDFIVIKEDEISVENIKKFLNNHDDFQTYAIRSSANIEDGIEKSYAGLFETFLNVDKDKVIDKILECMKIKKQKLIELYREKDDLFSSLKMEVILQIMIKSEISGVCFTKNPINGKNEMIIEAIYGVGEGIVSGKINGDKYVLDANNGKILTKRKVFQNVQYVCSSKNINLEKVPLLQQSKTKLNINLIKEIYNIISSMKENYEYELDIEWAIVGTTFFILQVRTITTIS